MAAGSNFGRGESAVFLFHDVFRDFVNGKIEIFFMLIKYTYFVLLRKFFQKGMLFYRNESWKDYNQIKKEPWVVAKRFR